MKRKLIQMAGKTLLVSLPSDWVKIRNLKKGDEVNVETYQEDLIVRTQKREEPTKEIQVDISSADTKSVKKFVCGLCKTGYDKLIVKDKDQAHKALVKKVLREMLLGFGITEQKSDYYIIEPLAIPSKEQFQSTWRRSLLVTMEAGEELLEGLKKSDFTKLKSTLDLENENNKLTNYCQQIVQQDKTHRTNLHTLLYLVIWQVEKICDNYRDMAADCIEAKAVPNKDSVKQLAEVTKLFRSFYEYFYKYKPERMKELHEWNQQIVKDIKKMMNKKREDSTFLGYLLMTSHQIGDLSTSFMVLNEGKWKKVI